MESIEDLEKQSIMLDKLIKNLEEKQSEINAINTTDDFLDDNELTGSLNTYDESMNCRNRKHIKYAMIDFAKYHVGLVLKQASEKAKTKVVSEYEVIVDKDSILNCYDLSKIK